MTAQISFFLSACLLVVCSACHAPNDNLIIPGIRVGNCVIHHTKMSEVGPDGNPHCGKFRETAGSLGGLEATSDASGQFIERLAVFDGRYQTVEGLHLGDSKQSIVNKLGSGTPVAYVIHKNGKLRNDSSSISYLEAMHYPGITFIFGTKNGVYGPGAVIEVGTEVELKSRFCLLDQVTGLLLPSTESQCATGGTPR